MEGATEPIFLPFMYHLHVFEIYICPDPAIFSLLMCSLCISLTSPATLELIKVNFIFDSNDNYYDNELMIYVMLMSGALLTQLSLIQPVHGYKELTLTSSFIMKMWWNWTKLESNNLSLMFYHYFARKAFCLSKSLWVDEIFWILDLNPWPWSGWASDREGDGFGSPITGKVWINKIPYVKNSSIWYLVST